MGCRCCLGAGWCRPGPGGIYTSDANGVRHDSKTIRQVGGGELLGLVSPCLEEIPDLIKFHNKHKDLDAWWSVWIMKISPPCSSPVRSSIWHHLSSCRPIPRQPSFGRAGLPTTSDQSQGELVAKHTGRSPPRRWKATSAASPPPGQAAGLARSACRGPTAVLTPSG